MTTIQEQLAAELVAMAEGSPTRGGTTRRGLEVAAEYVRSHYTPPEAPLGADHGAEAQTALSEIVAALEADSGHWGVRTLDAVAGILVDRGFARNDDGYFKGAS